MTYNVQLRHLRGSLRKSPQIMGLEFEQQVTNLRII